MLLLLFYFLLFLFLLFFFLSIILLLLFLLFPKPITSAGNATDTLADTGEARAKRIHTYIRKHMRTYIYISSATITPKGTVTIRS